MEELTIKIIVSFILILMASIGIYLGLCVLKLTKRVAEIQGDRDKALEDWYKLLRAKPMLSELERRMILNALNMPSYKNAIKDPKTTHHVRKTYRELKEKIKESFEI